MHRPLIDSWCHLPPCATVQVSAVATRLNETLRRFEQSIAMCNVARQFDPPMPELVQPHRRLLHEGVLRRLRVNGHPVTTTLFLFPDSAVLAYPGVTAASPYQLHRTLRLRGG